MSHLAENHADTVEALQQTVRRLENSFEELTKSTERINALNAARIKAVEQERDTYSRAADYWWNAYHQATTGKLQQPRSSDPEQDPAVRAMGQREHATQTLLADFVQWFDNWCPSNKCFAHTGLQLHYRAIALLKGTLPQPRT